MKRFDVYLVALDPTVGAEIQKTRPCVILSPDEMLAMKTILVAPMTSNGFGAPFRVPLTFQKKDGYILLDQMRSVDKKRLVRRMGSLSAETQETTLLILQAMFSR